MQGLRALVYVAGRKWGRGRSVLVVASLTAAVLSGTSPAYAAPGDLDPTFSGDGRQLTDFGAGDSGEGVAIQPDGKIVVAGSSSGSDFALARYNLDGSLDSSFSGDGRQTTDFSGNIEGGRAVALQPNGKIVVAGGSNSAGARDSDFALARYTSDGTLDSSFSGDGRQTTDFGGGLAGAGGVALQPDGKIVAAGFSSPSIFNSVFALARYNADGTLDSSFSCDGRKTTDFGRSGDNGSAVAIKKNGKIVAAGGAGAEFAPTR